LHARTHTAREEAVVVAPFENAKTLIGVVGAVRGKRDWCVHDLAALGARGVDELNAVLQHVVGGHDTFHRIVQLAALRTEFVLILDQNDGSRGRVDRLAALRISGRKDAVRHRHCECSPRIHAAKRCRRKGRTRTWSDADD